MDKKNDHQIFRLNDDWNEMHTPPTYTSAEAKAVNDAARHQMIRRLLADIRMDLQVCDVEGWDKREYIRMLQKEINHFKV